MTFADQSSFQVRCEWGLAAIQHLKPAEIVVIVDVLSFSTCVEIGVSRGAKIFPWKWKEESARQYAEEISAELADSRDTGSVARYSLSPTSLTSAHAALRLVLPSPNGSTLSLRAKETGATVVAGCLRNASALGAWLRTQRQSISVIPAGERWQDGSIRHSLEDLVGAGAILSHLDTALSPEARLAIAAYREFRDCLPETLLECSSGRELVKRGFRDDIELAAELDAGTSVPILTDDGFQSPTSLRDSITIRAANFDDAPAIVRLLQEAACWLRDSGRPLWEPADFTEEKILREISSWFVASAAFKIVGVFKLEDDDDFFWPDIPKGESLFLHKLAVSRTHAGRGLSSEMLRYAVKESRARGKSWLRLDCQANRSNLRGIYESLGFRLHSEWGVGPYLAARYEYHVSPSP